MVSRRLLLSDPNQERKLINVVQQKKKNETIHKEESTSPQMYLFFPYFCFVHLLFYNPRNGQIFNPFAFLPTRINHLSRDKKKKERNAIAVYVYFVWLIANRNYCISAPINLSFPFLFERK